MKLFEVTFPGEEEGERVIIRISALDEIQARTNAELMQGKTSLSVREIAELV